MLQPTHTWKIYMFIAVYWRACIDFKNVRQWRAWLVSIGAFKPGLPEHEDAEIKSIRKLLRRIGVPFRDRGGKPRKRNPTPIRNRKVHG
jgi:hypothetical protein